MRQRGRWGGVGEGAARRIEGLNQPDRVKPSWKSSAGRQESLQSVLGNMTTSSKWGIWKHFASSFFDGFQALEAISQRGCCPALAAIGQDNTCVTPCFLTRCLRCAFITDYRSRETKSTSILLDMGKIASAEFDLSGPGKAAFGYYSPVN